MNKVKNDFVLIIKSAFTNDKISLEIDSSLYKLSKSHLVDVMLYNSLKNSNIEVNKEFESIVKKDIYKGIFQDAEKESLKDGFRNNNIHFMMLKGAVIKDVYDNNQNRQMSDIDILIKKEDFPKLKKVMTSLGYEKKHQGGNHDVYYKKPFMNIELHRAMVDEIYGDKHNYYRNIWDKLIKIDDFEFKQTNEDFYIFMIVHAYKHFSEYGTGMRILTDIYSYLKKYDSLDFKYINNELDSLRMMKFSNNLKDLTFKIFESKKLNNDDLTILDFIIDSGAYGNMKNFSLLKSFMGDNELKSAKKTHIIKRLFPPFNVMKKRNPILKKAPVLLPVFYITRLIKGLFHINRHKNEIKTVSGFNKDDVNKMRALKEASGLEDIK